MNGSRGFAAILQGPSAGSQAHVQHTVFAFYHSPSSTASTNRKTPILRLSKNHKQSSKPADNNLEDSDKRNWPCFKSGRIPWRNFMEKERQLIADDRTADRRRCRPLCFFLRLNVHIFFLQRCTLRFFSGDCSHCVFFSDVIPLLRVLLLESGRNVAQTLVSQTNVAFYLWHSMCAIVVNAHQTKEGSYLWTTLTRFLFFSRKYSIWTYKGNLYGWNSGTTTTASAF